MTPKLIDDILKSDWLWHLSRLTVTFMYWYAGIGFALDFQGAQQAMASTGIQPLWVVAALTILVEIGGSLLIILDRLVWLGAGALGGILGAFVEGHGDVRAESDLHVHGMFRREKMAAAVEVRPEAYALVGDLAQLAQAEDLKPA